MTLDGRQVQLTPTEYGMLAELAAHAGRVLTHEHLLERVWGGRAATCGPFAPWSASSRASWATTPTTQPTSSPKPRVGSGCPGEGRRTGTCLPLHERGAPRFPII